MKEYRISKNRDEIIKRVKQKIDSDGKVMVWQKDPDKDPEKGQRVFKGTVQLTGLDVLEGIFSIDLLDEGLLEHFRPALETYFLLQDQDFVFKTKLAVDQPKKKSCLHFKIPQDVRLQEFRRQARTYIDSDEKRFVIVSFHNKGPHGGETLTTCPIFNISEGGICILVSKETLSSIDLSKEVSLEGLSFFAPLAHANKMKALVRNARIHAKKGLGSDELYALGLEFLKRES